MVPLTAENNRVGLPLPIIVVNRTCYTCYQLTSKPMVKLEVVLVVQRWYRMAERPNNTLMNVGSESEQLSSDPGQGEQV